MATIIEVLYKIKERNSSFKITDDNRLDDEFLISTMNDTRATLLREEYNRLGYIPSEYYQLNCCYEINCSEGSCSYNGIEVKDGQYTHKVKMKVHVKGLGNQAIRFIGDKSGSVKFSIKNFAEYVSYDKGRKWSEKTPLASIIGNNLLLKNLPTVGMKFICLLEILEDPRQSCDWSNDESDYPIPSVTKLVDMVLYRLMVSGNQPIDTINNAEDDTATPKIVNDLIGMQQSLQTEGSRQQARSNQNKE